MTFFCAGFYDTSNEVYDPTGPNFKRLRQQDMDGEMRRDKEDVSSEVYSSKLFMSLSEYLTIIAWSKN